MTRSGILGICIVMGTIGGALLLARGAQAFPADCDASCLGDWQGTDCSVDSITVCEEDGSPTDRIVCDGFNNANNHEVFAFSDAEGDSSIVFGDFNGEKFCCMFSEPYRLDVSTGNADDLLCLVANENECQDSYEDDHDADCDWGDGYWWHRSLLRTHDGDDVVYGSDFDGTFVVPDPDETVCDETSGDWCDDISTGSCDDTANYGDIVYAGDGPDRVAGDHTDTVCDHKFLGEAGNDKLVGSGADDWLEGGLGTHVILGRDGDDDLLGGGGDDHLDGGDDQDSVWGANGDDTVCGSAAPDGVVDYLYPGEGVEDGGGDVCATYNEDDDVHGHCESWRDTSPYYCPQAPW